MARIKKAPTDITPTQRKIKAPHAVPAFPNNLPIKAPKAVEKKQITPPANQQTP